MAPKTAKTKALVSNGEEKKSRRTKKVLVETDPLELDEKLKSNIQQKEDRNVRGKIKKTGAEPEPIHEVEKKSVLPKGRAKAMIEPVKDEEQDNGKSSRGRKKTIINYNENDKNIDGQPIVKRAKKSKPQPSGDTEVEIIKKKSGRGRKTTVKEIVRKEEESDGESEPVVIGKAKGKKRGVKEVESKIVDEDDGDNIAEVEQPTIKKKRGGVKDETKKAPAKNKTLTNYDTIDFTNKSSDKNGNLWNVKISCWNVDGIRAWLNKGGLEFIHKEKPNILCLQEIKCSKDKLPDEVKSIPGYHAYWLAGEKDGYAGVCVYSNQMAISVQYGLKDPDLDDEGRIITAEFEQFYIVCTYVPNAGRKLITLPKRLQWNKVFHKFIKKLDEKKPVIICGDMNVAHNEIDLANPKTNKKNAGFTIEERTGMTELLNDGFVDTFRHLYPDKKDAYTFWTYMMNSRAKNVGWRLDYFLVSERLMNNVCDNVIRNEVYGSDHCPITLFTHFSSVAKIPPE